jgi:hypothetical protein
MTINEGITMTDNLEIAGELPPLPDGFTKVAYVMALPRVPVVTAVLTTEDAERVAAFIRAHRVA